jgi:hypothetical protein
MTSRKDVAEKLTKYLKHQITLPELVDWSENAILEGGFEEGYEKTIREALGRLGVSDVKEFGLLWQDCEEIMRSLGYELKVDAIRAA